VTLKASTNNALYGWDGACAGTIGRECLLVMDSDKFVLAEFAHSALTHIREFHMKINGRGAIRTSPSDDKGYTGISHNTADTSYEDFLQYDRRTTVTLTADARYSGYRFVGWGGICAGFGTGACSIKMTSHKYAEATFAQIATGGAGSCLSRYFSPDEQRVQDIFIAYYGRPADVGGLKYWSHELKEKKGDASSIMGVFGNTPEFLNRYGFMNNSDLIQNLFAQLYGRPADPLGLNFYVNRLNTGQNSLASIALIVLDGTQESGSDARALANRRIVANHYTTTAEVRGPGGLTATDLVQLLPQVGEDEASVNAVCAHISNALN